MVWPAASLDLIAYCYGPVFKPIRIRRCPRNPDGPLRHRFFGGYNTRSFPEVIFLNHPIRTGYEKLHRPAESALKNYRAAAQRFRNEWQDHYELARAHPKFVDVVDEADARPTHASETVATLRDIIHHLPTNQKRYADTYARALSDGVRSGRCATHPLHHLIRAYLSGGTHSVCDGARVPGDAKERSEYVFRIGESGGVEACVG